MAVDIKTEFETEPSSLRVWVIVLTLALLWHALFAFLRPPFSGTLHSPKVEVKQIDPKKLEAIRKQWQDREKSILLNKDSNAPRELDAPKDARYMSDRNTRVEKEQRARNTNVIPKAGTAQQNTQGKTGANSERTRERTERSPLTRLGLPMDLTSTAKKAAPDEAAPRMTEGGDQALADKNLPVGNENLLNTEESVYYSFYARLYEAIGPLWQSHIRRVPQARRIAPGDYVSSVDVILDREGNLVQIRWIKASGVREFDDAVEQAWHKVGRFPNPPKDLLGEDGLLHSGWSFTVAAGSAFQFDYLPPERVY